MAKRLKAVPLKGKAVIKVQELNLPVKLTSVELQARGQELAQRTQQHLDLELRKKVEAEKLKEELKACDSEIHRLTHIINDKAEPRQVEVQHEDLGNGQVAIIRLDTGETVKTRAIDVEEQQDELFSDGGH